MAARKKKAAKKVVTKKAARRAVPKRKPRRKPESLRLRSISVGITVNDIHRSLAFYRDLLGFTVGELWKDGATLLGAELKAGTATIWIGQDDWAKGRDRVKAVGMRLFLTTTQPVDQIAERITAGGGTLDHPPEDHPAWGIRDFGVTDPDGVKLSIQNEIKRRR